MSIYKGNDQRKQRKATKKQPRKVRYLAMKKLAICISLIVVAANAYFGFGSASNTVSKYPVLHWPSENLGAIIPRIDAWVVYGEVKADTENYLWMDLYEISEETFEQYVSDCVDAGFSVNLKLSGNYFLAYDCDSHELILDYDSEELTLRILVTCVEASDVVDYLEEVTGIEVEDILDYIEENTGLDTEEITEQMEDMSNGIMEYIEELTGTDSDSEASSEEEDAEDGSVEESEDDSADDTSIREDFKQTLDEYEAFADEYIAFAEEYKNSDDISGYVAGYVSYITQYMEYAEKIDALASEDMTSAEREYYNEVTTRVLQKLLTI